MKHPTPGPFVPLAGPATPAAATAAAPAPAARPGFVPADPAPGPARGMTPAPAEAPGPEPAAVPAATVHARHAAPRLTFERDGDRITRILVHCACGEVIPVDCRYAEPNTLSA